MRSYDRCPSRSEYDAAFTDFFGQTLQALARARSPILAQIKTVETSGTVGSRIRDRDGMDIELVPGKTSTEMAADLNAVRDVALAKRPAYAACPVMRTGALGARSGRCLPGRAVGASR